MIPWFRVFIGERDLAIKLEKFNSVTACQWYTENQETFRQRLHYLTNMTYSIQMS